jgi:hypothetical protein
MTNQPPYRAAGTFAGEIYVTRAADERLLAAIHRNDRFPYIVAPRQSGKSSLLLRTRASLDRAHFRWAFVDVSTLPVSNYEQFWRELLVEVARTASLPQQDITPEHPEDTLSAWLRQYPQRLTIFLDEIDAVVGLAFRDQFLGKLRSLFNTRAEDPNFDRLMLVLAGATAPTQLIQDPARSPFNVGVEIRLDDLTLSLTESLASHLDQTNAAIAPGVPARLLHWTGGSVYLAQLLLEDLWQVGTQRRALDVDDVDAAAMAIVARAAGEIHFQNIYRLVADRPLSLDALSDLCAGRSIEVGVAQDLRLAGISDGLSPFRNPIYRLVFGATGSLRLTHASELITPDSAAKSVSHGDFPAAGRHEPLGKLSDLVDTLFCGESAQYGPYTRSDEPPEVLIPDTLIRFVLIDADQQRVNLQLYHGLSAFGGALWSREVRALTRVSWRQHPALPTIVGGAYIEAYNVAFVITTVARFRLSEPGALAFIAQDRSEAIRQFMLLAQGLGILHEQGITHRNLHPGAIEYIESDSDEARRYTLRLSRFEMSAMVSNLARHRMSHDRLLGEQLRRLYLESDGAALALAYCPPERAEWLFDDESTRPENDRADVYALGVLGWHWFVRRGNDQPAWLAPERSSAWVRRLNQHMLASLVNNPDVPPLLAVLLREMLALEPSDRISIFKVIEALTRDYGRLVASAAAPHAPETLYIGFMPVESEKTIYRWGWIQQDPREPTGRKELQGFLETELQAAEILYCADGFAAYRAGHNSKREQDALRSARYVLVGKQAYWFCDLYRSADLTFDPNAQSVEQLLLIKYVVHRHRAWRLEATPLRRPIPGVLQFVPILARGTLDLDLIRANGASWRPLLASVRHEQSTPAWMQNMESALTFLQAFRRAELEARVFPYSQKDGGGLTVDLTFDTSRDRKYQFSDALRSLYFREFRTPMGRLFESLDGERSVQFSVYGDLHGRPNYEVGPVLSLLFDRRLDDDTVRMYNPRGRRGLPTQGWICPEDDRGSFVQLQRQANAVQELLHARSLLHQLHHPSAIRGSRARWKGVGDELKGRSNQIVQDMLSYEPFYALHGPPGSGKTTVAATAVAAYLETDPAYRVLISSQSHNALDNLGGGFFTSAKTTSRLCVSPQPRPWPARRYTLTWCGGCRRTRPGLRSSGSQTTVRRPWPMAGWRTSGRSTIRCGRSSATGPTRRRGWSSSSAIGSAAARTSCSRPPAPALNGMSQPQTVCTTGSSSRRRPVPGRPSWPSHSYGGSAGP